MARILQLHNSYREPGGEDTVVAAEANLLRSAGHHVLEYRGRNAHHPIRAAGQLAFSVWNRSSARAVMQLARRDRPDIAHIHNTWFALSPSVCRALKNEGIPVVMTLHNYRLLCANSLLFRDGRPCVDCVGSSPWHGVRHRCYRDSFAGSVAAATTIAAHRARGTWDRDVDLFVAPSEFAKLSFVAGGLPERKVVVKPHFVADPGRRMQSASASDKVLFVGRLSQEKGIFGLLEAWRRAGVRGLELIIAGDGPLKRAAESRASAGIRFLGSVNQKKVRELMCSARALVFPSLAFETQGMVITEALAASLPVLGPNHGAPKEMLSPLGARWLVSPGEAVMWAAAIRGLADDIEVERASRRARAAYERRYTPERALHLLERTYVQAGVSTSLL